MAGRKFSGREVSVYLPSKELLDSWSQDAEKYGCSLSKYIFEMVKIFPKLTFIFLTKQPQNLIKWSPFPDNCWVGVSATNRKMWFDAIWELQSVKAKIKFISFEPLLDWIYSDKEPDCHIDYTADWFRRSGISWLIIGQQTPVRDITMPNKAWIDDIIHAADKVGVPVFLKNNLQCVFDINCKINLRQEFPTI